MRERVCAWQRVDGLDSCEVVLRRLPVGPVAWLGVFHLAHSKFSKTRMTLIQARQGMPFLRRVTCKVLRNEVV
jgi:hypothetical protein